jgi:hypothetical protein
MTYIERVGGQVIIWAARLAGLLLIYLLVRYFRPTFFYKGWGSLQPTYGVLTAQTPANVPMHHTSLRVGTEHYSQTAYVGLGTTGLYLQRPALTPTGRLLCVPYKCLTLKERPSRTGPLRLAAYGIFQVDGVEVWLDSPYAEQLIAYLSAP